MLGRSLRTGWCVWHGGYISVRLKSQRMSWSSVQGGSLAEAAQSKGEMMDRKQMSTDTSDRLTDADIEHLSLLIRHRPNQELQITLKRGCGLCEPIIEKLLSEGEKH